MKTKCYSGLIIALLFFSFCVKMDAQSQDLPPWAWVKSLSAAGNIYGYAIAVDPNESGDIYVCGGFEGLTDFDPGPGTFHLTTGSLSVGIFIAKYDDDGNFVWAKSMVGLSDGAASPRSMAIQPTGSGDIYITGRFNGTVDFDPGANTFPLTSAGKDDIFISKLDSEGNFVWATRIGGSDDDYGFSLALDPGGSRDVYFTGQFKGTVDFDPGPGISNLISSGDYDIFISRLSASGDFLWTKQIGGTGSDNSRAIAIDPSGSGKVYVRGFFEDTVDFDPGVNSYELIAAADRHNFVSAIDTSGHFLMAIQMGRGGDGFFEGSIALDPTGSGDVYTTGSFHDTCDFDPDEVVSYPLTSNGNSDIFISKLNGSGELTWARAMGGTSQDYGATIVIQPGQSGNVYTMGTFFGLADIDPGEDSVPINSAGARDIFISGLDKYGHFKWVKTINGVDEDFGNAIAIDNEFIYVTGAFFGSSVSFDSITIPNNNSAGQGRDLFFGKLDFKVATADIASKAQQLNIYPNPASNELTIELESNEFISAAITMYNVLGEVVYSAPAEIIEQKKNIDISGLSAGIYFVELNMDGGRVIEKVIVE